MAGATTASCSTRRVTATARGVVGGGSRTISLLCSIRLRELVDAPKGFVLLTAHTPGFGPEQLAAELTAPFGVADAEIDRGALQVTARTGATLDLGAFARWPGAR